MAKTLKDFLEGYLKVKSADEQKFIDKHVTAKNPDRNGNGDDVFKGSTKTIDRRKDRKGYNPGEDEKVYEALKGNQHKIDANKNGKLDAHDFKLLRKKKKVAEEAEDIDEAHKINDRVEIVKGSGKGIVGHIGEIRHGAYKGAPKTYTVYHGERGAEQVKKEHIRAIKKVGVKEEIEAIDEISAGLSARAGDKADNRVRALANKRKPGSSASPLENKLRAQRNKFDSYSDKKQGYTAEEAEQIDEISKGKLTDYRAAAKKQGTDIQNKMKMGGGDWSKDLKDTDTLKKRLAGYKMAGRKTNPDLAASVGKAPRVAATEEVQIDETAKIVAHLQKRYGDNIRKSHVSSAAKDFGVDASKLAKAVRTKLGKNMLDEESELDEKLNMDKASMGTVVKDFQKSNAPQFKGKSQDKRRVMAIAAKLTAERGGKPLNKEERLQNCLTDISESHQRIMLEVFDKLNEDNKSKFLKACITPDGVDQMLDFAIRHRGE